jgi:hypothetical protein
MKCNQAGRDLIERRYNRAIDETLLNDIEHVISRNLQGAPTTDNQFAAFCVCAYDFGLYPFKVSAVFQQHGNYRKNAALWLTPYLTHDGLSAEYRKEEQSLYMAPDTLQAQAA